VLDSLLAAADDGEDRIDDLHRNHSRGAADAFMPLDVVPM
jgi:hypothetical protein